jgi:hypothetical protein
MKLPVPGSKIDSLSQILAILFFFGWNLYYGALINTPYPKVLVSLYQYPFWRLLLVGLIISSALWNEPLSILVGIAVFFYLMDMPHFLEPWN